MSRVRIVITLAGDYQNNANVRTKHFYFFEALAKKFEITGVFDASLHGFSRWMNALSVMERDRFRWREHFHKNPAAFRKRSTRVTNFLRTCKESTDIVLQIGALFDSTAPDLNLPCLIYSDYTSVLSARKPEGGRSPFSGEERLEWIACETAALHHASYVCPRSRLVRNSLLQDYNLPPDKVAVIGGGVNFAALPELPNRHLRREPVLLFVGKDFYRKGGDLLIDAFRLVIRKRPGARLILVTQNQIPEDLPLQNVTLIKEECSRERMLELYASSDVFVLPSRLETWGDVLLEAMATGLPCVGVRSDAMSEIIDDQETGFLVPPQDVTALTQRLLILIQQPELRDSMGKAAKKKIESEFLWDHVAERLERIVDLTLARSHQCV